MEIEDQLAQTKRKLARLRELCSEGRISPDELDEDRERLHRRENKLRAELESVDPKGLTLEPSVEGQNAAN